MVDSIWELFCIWLLTEAWTREGMTFMPMTLAGSCHHAWPAWAFMAAAAWFMAVTAAACCWSLTVGAAKRGEAAVGLRAPPLGTGRKLSRYGKSVRDTWPHCLCDMV